MSVMTQHLVRILQCDKRYFTLTAKRTDKLEEVVMDCANVEKGYNDQTEKYWYELRIGEDMQVYESKNRTDALVKLILRNPFLYEPVRAEYNKMVCDRFKTPKDKAKERAEKRYQRRLELIQRLKGL